MADENKVSGSEAKEWRKLFLEKLYAKVPQLTNQCPICTQNTIVVNERMWSPVEYKPGDGGIVLGGPRYPYAVLLCTNCGYSREFSLIILGMLASDGTLKE